MKKSESQQGLILQPSIAERNRRWRSIRKKMIDQDLDCLLIWGSGAHWGRGSSSLRYASAIGANETQGLCIFPLDGDPTVIVWHPAIAKWWIRVQKWITDIRGRSMHGWTPVILQRLKELKFTQSRIGLVDFNDYQTYALFSERQNIIEALPNAEFSEQSKLIHELRMVKSEEEITLLERAGKIVDQMFEAVLENAKPGVKESSVYGSIVNALIENEGEYPEMILWDAGAYPNVHPGRIPTNRRLRKGDLISIELHSKYAGYLGHGERCISLGKPKQEFEYIQQVSRKAFESGYELLKPGVDLKDIAEAFYRPVKEAGMGVTELGLHGHGLSSGEFPTFLTFPFHYPGADKPESFLLKQNMVFGVTVDLYDPHFRNGETGLMLADTVQVTKRGPRRLCKLPLDLLEIPC